MELINNGARMCCVDVGSSTCDRCSGATVGKNFHTPVTSDAKHQYSEVHEKKMPDTSI